MNTSPRRWLRLMFTLRTLFVLLTIAALGLGWVGYHIQWIRQRHLLLGRFLGEGDLEMPMELAPGGLAWFGEGGLEVVSLPPDASDADVQEVRRAFPEAEVTRETTR